VGAAIAADMMRWPWVSVVVIGLNVRFRLNERDAEPGQDGSGYLDHQTVPGTAPCGFESSDAGAGLRPITLPPQSTCFPVALLTAATNVVYAVRMVASSASELWATTT
jgi:hypothetical protein